LITVVEVVAIPGSREVLQALGPAFLFLLLPVPNLQLS
jgi:hypothetical protein